ncbi:MAG: glycosyltransferase family 2 protein [Candidatus Pacearchaeota archaeon]
MAKEKDVSVILPCLNEEKTIGNCIKKALQVFKENKINGEIIVVDNGSTDNSVKIASSLGVNVIKEPLKGYGSAYLRGFSEAKGKYIILADSDGTYDLLEIPKFLTALKENDFVIGSRFKGEIKKGAMPFLHRYIGNPLLSFLLGIFFRKKISDCHSGFRAIRKDVLEKLNLKTTGMEFASEMIIKAIKSKIKIKEIPVSYHPREGESKLKSFHDGWRHLRFMLLYSPLYLFIIPGFLLFLTGSILMLSLFFGTIAINNVRLDIHSMILSSVLIIVGFQIITLGTYAKIYAVKNELEKPSKFIRLVETYLDFEKGALTGIVIVSIGMIISLIILTRWINLGFGNLSEMRNAILAMTLIVLGIQIAFSAFFISILNIHKK